MEFYKLQPDCSVSLDWLVCHRKLTERFASSFAAQKYGIAENGDNEFPLQGRNTLNSVLAASFVTIKNMNAVFAIT